MALATMGLLLEPPRTRSHPESRVVVHVLRGPHHDRIAPPAAAYQHSPLRHIRRHGPAVAKLAIRVSSLGLQGARPPVANHSHRWGNYEEITS